MRRFLIAAAAILVFAGTARAELKVVTTTTDFADLARQIGGDRVHVHSVMKGPENVHNVLAKPTEMLALNKADLFVHAGLDAEPWRDNLVKGARNPKILPGQPGNVDMSRGIELIDVPTERITRAQGDVHAYGNPHYQLSPKNAQQMAATLVGAMAQLDPANADFYRANAVDFVNGMAETHQRLRRELAPYAGLKVVTFHDSWRYLAVEFDIQIAGTIEPKPGITPSPAQVRDVIELMKREGVKVVVVETYSDERLARSVAQRAGAQLVRLPDHVLGTPEARSWQELFEHDIRSLIEAARRAGVEPKQSAEPEVRRGQNGEVVVESSALAVGALMP